MKKEIKIIEKFREMGHGEFADRLLSYSNENVESKREKEVRFLKNKIQIMQSRLKQLSSL